MVIYATGYQSMNGWLETLISPEVADRVGNVWGFGSDTPKDPGPWEGELRNMWKPTNVDHPWVHGGNLHQSRHYSQFLALQLKARCGASRRPSTRCKNRTTRGEPWGCLHQPGADHGARGQPCCTPVHPR